jgi:hypothetical protein
VTEVVYLHELFSSLTPGEYQLRVSARVHVPGRVHRVVVLADDVRVRLVETSDEELGMRIRKVVSQVATSADSDERYTLYRGLLDLPDHPELVHALLLGWASDDVGLHCLSSLRLRRLVRMCETYGLRQLLVECLLKQGSRSADSVFTSWQDEGVVPTQEQLRALIMSRRDLWVVLYCLKYFGDDLHHSLYGSFYRSLKSDLELLQEEVSLLREPAPLGGTATSASPGLTAASDESRRPATPEAEAAGSSAGSPPGIFELLPYLLVGALVGALAMHIVDSWTSG